MSNLSRVIEMVQAAISASFFPIYGEVWVWLLLSQSYVDPLPSIYIYFYYYGSIDIKSKKKWKRQRCWRNTYDISWTTNYNHKIKWTTTFATIPLQVLVFLLKIPQLFSPQINSADRFFLSAEGRKERKKERKRER